MNKLVYYKFLIYKERFMNNLFSTLNRYKVLQTKLLTIFKLFNLRPYSVGGWKNLVELSLSAKFTKAPMDE